MSEQSENAAYNAGYKDGLADAAAEIAHLRKSIANSDRDHWWAEAHRLREAIEKATEHLANGRPRHARSWLSSTNSFGRVEPDPSSAGVGSDTVPLVTGGNS